VTCDYERSGGWRLPGVFGAFRTAVDNPAAQTEVILAVARRPNGDTIKVTLAAQSIDTFIVG